MSAKGVDILLSQIISKIYENTSEDISGQDLQDQLIDIVDSLCKSEYNALIPYKAGQSVVFNDGGVKKVFLCKTDTTPGESPISVPAKWEFVSSPYGVNLDYISLDITVLKAITGYSDNDQVLVNSNNGLYGFSSTSTATPDDDLVVKPDNVTLPAAGRWLKVKVMVDTSITGSLGDLISVDTTNLVSAINWLSINSMEIVNNITALKAIPLSRRDNRAIMVRHYNVSDESTTTGGVINFIVYKSLDYTNTAWQNLSNWGSFDLNTQTIGDLINSSTNKTTLVDGDLFSIRDFVTGLLQKVSFANLKTNLKNYFDNIYALLSGATFTGDLKVNKTGEQFSASKVLTRHEIVKSGADGVLRITNPVYYSDNNISTGVVKITLPVSWTGSVIMMKISGYSYDGSKFFSMKVSGANPESAWSSAAASLTGYCPFDRVRFGHDGSNCCILLGTLTTQVQYVRVLVDEVLVSYDGVTVDWVSGWDMSMIFSESGITIDSIVMVRNDYEIEQRYQQLTSASAILMDLALGLNAKLVMGHNVTLTLSGLKNGDAGNIEITQGATDYTFAISPTPYVLNDGSSDITLVSGSGSVTVVSYSYDGTRLLVTYNKSLDIPTKLSDLEDDSTHRLVTDTQINNFHAPHSDDETTSTILNKIGDGSKISSSYLPSYVDDVIDTYIVGGTPLASDWLSLTVGGSPLTPETGKIYIVLTDGDYLNTTYRWSGSVYVSLSNPLSYASQAEAEAGTDNSKVMTALRVLQSIVYQVTNYVFSALNTTSKTIIGAINELKSAMLTDAPADGTVYGRKDNVWSELVVGSGGYSARAYLTNVASTDVSGYKQVSYTNDVSTSTFQTVVNNNELLIAAFLYEAVIGITTIDAGQWLIDLFAKVSTASGVTQLKAELFVRTVGGTETVLFTKYSREINNTDYEHIEFESNQSYFTINATDRLGVKIYAKTTHNSNVTVNMQVGDDTSSYVVTPLALSHKQIRRLNEDPNYQHVTTQDIANWNIHDLTTLDTINDNDEFSRVDTINSNVLKKTTWSNIKSKIQAFLQATALTITEVWTFASTKLAIKGSGTGKNIIASANTSANDYIHTLQAKTGTLADLDDVALRALKDWLTSGHVSGQTSQRVAAFGADGAAILLETVFSNLSVGDFTGNYAGLATESNWTNNITSAVSGSSGDRCIGIGSLGTKYEAMYSQYGWIRDYFDHFITDSTLIAALTTTANWTKISDIIYYYNAASGDRMNMYYDTNTGCLFICINGSTHTWLRFGIIDYVTVSDTGYIPKPQVEVNKADNATFSISAKYDIIKLMVEAETTTAGNISIGSADGLSDIVASTALPTVIGNKKQLTYIVNADYPSASSRTLYINIDSAATVKLHIVTQKMFE